MTIVTTHYRYKRPPRKRKAVPLGAPSVGKMLRLGAVVVGFGFLGGAWAGMDAR
jgi:hypothetical protein